MPKNSDVFKGVKVEPSPEYREAMGGYELLPRQYRYFHAIRIVTAKLKMHIIYDAESKKVKYIGESKAELLSWIMVTLRFKERTAYSILKAARNQLPPGGRDLVNKTWDADRKGRSLYEGQFREGRRSIERQRERINARERARIKRLRLLGDRWYRFRRTRRYF